jgi:hypothetical protein
VLGLALWLLGWLTNLHSDGILRRLWTSNDAGVGALPETGTGTHSARPH